MNAVDPKYRDMLNRIAKGLDDAMTTENRMWQFFSYGHLPPHLQEVSKPFGELAKAEGWNKAFMETLKDELDAHEDRLTRDTERQMDAETEAAALDRARTLGNSLVQNYTSG